MSMSDNIADLLTRIRNAQKAKLLTTCVALSKFKINILDVLKLEGYIIDYIIDSKNKLIEIKLKYLKSEKPAIYVIKRVSKPGKRIYSSIRNLVGYYNNMGIYILSTSRGVMSDQEAKKQNVGGEIICKVF